MKRLFLYKIIVFFFVGLNNVYAMSFNLLVAPKKSEHYKVALGLAKHNTNTFAFKKIDSALEKAHELLNGKTARVFIKIAEGDYKGRARSGAWTMPFTKSPNGALHISGGYNKDFKVAQPFTTPSRLITRSGQNEYILKFASRGHVYKSISITGLHIDVGSRNFYDSTTNSLRMDRSPTREFFSFSYLTTDKLTIRDNLFANSAYKVLHTSVKALSTESEVSIANNFFINNVLPLTIETPGQNLKIKNYNIQNNTFIHSWPVKMDPKGSNPGAIRIGNNRAAQQLTFKNNLFFNSLGGVIFAAFAEKHKVKINISNNLYFANGSLFKTKSKNTGLVVGRYFKNKQHDLYNNDDLEEDFPWQIANNVSLDPKINIIVPVEKTEAKKKPASEEDDYDSEEGPINIAQSWSGFTNYAPLYPIHLDKLPLPQEKSAQKFGVNIEQSILKR